MHLNLALAFFALNMGGDARRNPPLMRPAILNIGFVCRWEARCMSRQEQAMNRSLKYVRKYRPPAWKVQLCNRNASRGRLRVDWVGMSNCIRNPRLRPPPRNGRR